MIIDMYGVSLLHFFTKYKFLSLTVMLLRPRIANYKRTLLSLPHTEAGQAIIAVDKIRTRAA
jgi:hypothetical protein